MGKEFGLAVLAAATGFVVAAVIGETVVSRVGRVADAIGFDDVFGG